MLMNMIINNILKTVNTGIIIFDLDEVKILKSFAMFLRIQATLFVLFTVIEICLFKYWLKFILKRLVTMDDSVIVVIFSLQNILMSVLFAMARVQISDDQYIQTEKKL